MKERLVHSILVLAIIVTSSQCSNVEKFSLLMPNVSPHSPDMYLCTPVKVDPMKNYYLVGFEPNTTSKVAHHMLLYGCSKPGSSKPVWVCGEMSSSDVGVEQASVCQGASQILYAWAMDAPELNLPEGVGFKVGKDSDVNYLVLQVHYVHVEYFNDGNTDNSGVVLHYTDQYLNKLAGVFLLGSSGQIAPHSTEYLESVCTIHEDKVIHPIAYRTHTHALGKVVSGYVIKPNNTWIELGKRNPLTPQMFYKIHNEILIEKGDKVASRCTMLSTRDRWTYVGSTVEDEMCNFYLMYYVEEDEPLNQKYCYSAGPPLSSWNKAGLVNIPNIEASTL